MFLPKCNMLDHVSRKPQSSFDIRKTVAVVISGCSSDYANSAEAVLCHVNRIFPDLLMSYIQWNSARALNESVYEMLAKQFGLVQKMIVIWCGLASALETFLSMDDAEWLLVLESDARPLRDYRVVRDIFDKIPQDGDLVLLDWFYNQDVEKFRNNSIKDGCYYVLDSRIDLRSSACQVLSRRGAQFMLDHSSIFSNPLLLKSFYTREQVDAMTRGLSNVLATDMYCLVMTNEKVANMNVYCSRDRPFIQYEHNKFNGYLRDPFFCGVESYYSKKELVYETGT